MLGLFLLAPWMAEFSWGGLGLSDMAVAVVFLGPLYGCAAILVREIARRTHRGWPTMLLLGAAFGLLQCGVVDQSVFNPHYMHYDFQHPAHVPGLGVSAVYLLAFVVGHAVVSIGAPIALVETYAWRRGAAPWLGPVGLSLVAAAWVLASVLNHVDVRQNDGHGFQAEPWQTGTAIAVVLLLVALAITRTRGSAPPPAGRPAPSPWALGPAAFVVYLLWLPHESWFGVAVAVLVLPAAALLLTRWSRRPGWGPRHRCAVAAGVLLVGPVEALTGSPYADVSARTELLNDSVAVIIAIAVVLTSGWALRRHPAQSAGDGETITV